MVTPERIQEALCKRGIANRYSFARPISTHAPLPIETFPVIHDFLGRLARSFKTNYARRAKDLLHGRGYLTTIDDASSHHSSRHLTKALFQGDETAACRKIELHVRSLLHSKSFGLVGYSTQNIDIVKDVLNLAPIHWIAEEIGLPLKTGERPHGVIFEQQADEAYKSIYSYVAISFRDLLLTAARYIFMENDPAVINQLEDIAKRHVRMLKYHLRTHVDSLNSGVCDAFSSLLLLTSRSCSGTGSDGSKTCSGPLRLATSRATTIFTRTLRRAALRKRRSSTMC